MKQPTDEQLKQLFISVIADGFNRSLNTLESNGAIDLSRFKNEYTSSGSHYYDLVSEQIEYTAKLAVSSLKELQE